MMCNQRCYVLAWLLAVLGLAILMRGAQAEGGPGDVLQTYTTNDGLGSGSVHRTRWPARRSGARHRPDRRRFTVVRRPARRGRPV